MSDMTFKSMNDIAEALGDASDFEGSFTTTTTAKSLNSATAATTTEAATTAVTTTAATSTTATTTVVTTYMPCSEMSIFARDAFPVPPLS